jgi:putative methionine-R-sulfoxide reductase with GAF domain
MEVLRTQPGTTSTVVDRLSRALRTLGEANLVLVSARSEQELLARMCTTITETGGYLLAWVGMRLDDEARSVVPVTSAGAVGYLDEITVSWGATSSHGQGPTGRGIRTGTIQVLDDSLASPSYTPWREEARRWGFRASCVLPLRCHGDVVGALCIYSGETGAFGPDTVALLEKLAAALSYGIERLRDGERLERSLDATIVALAALAEMRDPYTAGHQCRVGLLAEALATTLGLPPEDTRGIRIAGDLHDIGKVVVPAEILTRPSRLGPEEIALVRLHPRAGHDVLAGIDFRWPVAQMVLQHHARLDGSGYPQRLRGNEILRGAQLLAVADTVEAMTNHRPYRPGLGLDQALACVRSGAGVTYAADVVEACISLFESDAFAFAAEEPDPWVITPTT